MRHIEPWGVISLSESSRGESKILRVNFTLPNAVKDFTESIRISFDPVSTEASSDEGLAGLIKEMLQEDPGRVFVSKILGESGSINLAQTMAKSLDDVFGSDDIETIQASILAKSKIDFSPADEAEEFGEVIKVFRDNLNGEVQDMFEYLEEAVKAAIQGELRSRAVGTNIFRGR